eukprot:s854_g10.t1
MKAAKKSSSSSVVCADFCERMHGSIGHLTRKQRLHTHGDGNLAEPLWDLCKPYHELTLVLRTQKSGLAFFLFAPSAPNSQIYTRFFIDNRTPASTAGLD